MSVTPERQELVATASQFFDDAVLTGAEIAEDKSDIVVSASAFKGLQSLNERVESLRGIEVIYSGMGFGPVIDNEGEVNTGYSFIENAKGTLHHVYVSDAREMQYVQPDNVYMPDDDTDASGILVMDEGLQELFEFRQSLRDAPEGLRLFVEFLIRKEVDIDKAVRGHAIRVPSYSVYNIMDAATLEVHSIDEKPIENQKAVLANIGTGIESTVDEYRRTIQSKAFRRLSAARQIREIEQYLSLANEALRLDRFIVISDVENVYVPEPEKFGDSGGFEHAVVETTFAANCLRLDCVEASCLSPESPIRKRRGNFNSLTSMCVVVEINDMTRDLLEVDTNILWIPVFNQLDQLMFKEPEVI